MRDRVLHRGSAQPYPRPIDGDPGLTPAGCLLAIALAAAFSWGADVEELMRLAKTARNWTAWRESMWEYIDALRQDQEG